MPDYRLSALQDFLNDKPDKLAASLFKWRTTYYEVIPYREILKSTYTRPDHFVKYTYKHILYGIRELSQTMLKKYYSKFLIDK